MLQFLGSQDAHDAILRAIEHCLKDGPRTPDLGGKARTEDIGRAIADHIAAHA
ncbi:Tartrate dehydrogenase/decarboxylase [compost metagenome]